MAVTESNMLPLGTIAPDFDLPDTISGQNRSLQSLKGVKGTVVMFLCNHCPFVQHIRPQLIAIAEHYRDAGIAFVAISANDIVEYPQDAPNKMRDLMNAWGNPFAAYLYDETQEVAKAYQAACTPDFYVFDAKLACVYRGRMDGSTPQNDMPLTGSDLRAALENLLLGQPLNPHQVPSVGCNIKWKK